MTAFPEAPRAATGRREGGPRRHRGGALWGTRLVLGLACVLAGAGEAGAADARVAEPDVRRDAAVEAVQRAMPSVVNVATETVVPGSDALEDLFRDFFGRYYRRRPPNTQYSLGSGVIIDEEGFVLTNFHVVNRASRIWVRLADGREFECEKVSGTSASDVALLKINAPATEKFTAIGFAADDDLLLGETVLALGNPFGLGGSVSRGILSSKSRRPPAENEPLDVLDWLQTDAAINPGNSGGPLVNLRGELMGINVAIYREGQGIGFAVPVKRIAQAIADIYSPEVLKRLWFGARLRPGVQPLSVVSLEPDSPADQAGLRVGDQVVAVDGKPPRSFIGLIQRLIEAGDRHPVTLQVRREGEPRRLTLRLRRESAFFNSDLVRQKTGLGVQELTPQLAESLGLFRVAGILIADVEKASPGAEAELQPGMVITGVDGQETDRVVTLARRLHARAKGDVVKLDIVAPVQRGILLRITSGVVALKVR
ncbi:MAG: trypsin-like peptidase domain-containing protein [Verrucomicrobia bacterium]|nr:trypsin-like peptidase domain-containing protein [Verrucomicrobiota bacterium]